MELKLVRKYCKDEYTIGQLFVIENGKAIWVADTLEDKVRDYNKDGDLLDEGEEKEKTASHRPCIRSYNDYRCAYFAAAGAVFPL